MKTIKLISLAAAAALCAHADSLDAVLARMDASAKTFKSATAKLKKTEYTALLKESQDDFGVLRIRREKNGVTAITEYSKPAEHKELLKDQKAWVYNPAAKVANVYDLSKYKSAVDQYSLLAFGSSGVELRKSYDVKFAGSEKIGSKEVGHLELIPKSEEVKKMFTKFELWVPEGQGNAVREKISTPSDNYYLLDYSDVQLNVSLKDADFDLKMPKDVKIVKAK